MDRTADSYEYWARRGRDLTLEGSFGKALEAFRTARRQALRSGDARLIDVADLNVAMVLIQLGAAREGEDGLREILLRTRDDRTASTAAYHLGSSLRRQGRYDKAMSYAIRALDRASAAGAIDLMAAAHNLVGNIYLSQSYVDEALERYRTSLELRERQGGDTRYSRAILLENTGYCLLHKGELEEGIATIRHALILAVEVGDERCRAECLQDLCYAYLLMRRHREADRWGHEALALAVERDYADIEENCHYLLGEIGSKTGNLAQRDRHFERLQQSHPELPFLKDFLCAVDVTRIITLKR